MIKKSFVICIVSILIVFSLLEGIVGTKGLVVNRELDKILLHQTENLDRKRLIVEALKNEYDATLLEESLLDHAIKIGKARSGDEIYFFKESQEVLQLPSAQQLRTLRPAFTGIASFWLLCIASGIVSVIFAVVYAIGYVKKNKGNHHGNTEHREV